MKHYLIPKVRWLFNSFLTKKFNRSTNVALAGNGFWLCDGGFYVQSIFKTAIAKPVLAVRSFSTK